ncbi:hypothetical protein [Massilia sp. DWR3-1-1]|uniref:hypothetical protein n=1 Tax=Massilia sp. DWR3-1-1 TaxID=2804559 RepID=UPI003CF0C484
MPVPRQQSDFDAIVIGGSYAGLSAALQLARAQRRVLAALARDWGQVTFFLNRAFDPSAAQLAALADGRRRVMAGLFVVPRTSVGNTLAAQLGCAMEEGPLGQFVQTDGQQASTVDGVLCCGDMARAAGNVAFAVADGAMAGVAAHRSLIAALRAMSQQAGAHGASLKLCEGAAL